MSTKPEASQDELDRTDELPRLDVAAYEASLAGDGDPLSRTDTWAVEALRQTDTSEVPVDDASSLARNRESAAPLSRAVTTDVDRILKRIADLETEIASAQTLNKDLESRSQSLHADRAALEKRASALETDNARLGEYRTIALDRVQRLEQQLLDRSAQHDTRVSELTAARSEEQSAAARTRELLERQIAQITTQLADLQDQHTKVHRELQASRDLSTRRAEAIDELQQSLTDADKTAARLGRNLAAKLAECDTSATIIERRNAAIAALESAREDLTGQLQHALAREHELAAKLASAGSDLNVNLRVLNEREHELAAKNQRLDQLAADIERLTGDLQMTSQERDATADALSAEKEQQDRTQRALAARVCEIDELHNSLQQSRSHATTLQDHLHEANLALAEDRETINTLNASLVSEQQRYEAVRADLEMAQTTVRTLSGERTELAPLREQLATRSEELQRAQTELATAQDDTAALRSELAAQTNRSLEREQEFASMQHLTAQLRQNRDELRQIADTLRGELQIARDERAIMAVKLDKARVRTKAMAQEIFRRDNRIASLKSDLAVHTEALDAIRRDVSRATGEPESSAAEPAQHVLEPLERDGAPILLDRKIMTIGRTDESDICIPSKLISRNHARLLIGPNAVILEDAGSTNGCYVNNREVRQHVMHEGDVLQLGDLKYRLATRSPHRTLPRDNVVSIAETRRLPVEAPHSGLTPSR